MAKLENLRRALAKAQKTLAETEKTSLKTSYGGSMGGGVLESINPEYANAQGVVALLQKQLSREELKATALDPSVPEEDRKRAQADLASLKEEARADMPKYAEDKTRADKILGDMLGKEAEEQAVEKNIEDTLADDFPEVKVAPVPAKPAAAPKPAPVPVPVPTPKDVKGLDEDVKAIRAERLKQQQLRTKQMEREGAEADKAADQRAYNALTPAQKLELDVRSREQKQAERARAAVSERREQLAADEEYKGMQIASSGSFKRGDVTQYVDPTERAAAQEYFTNRAADIRAGENPAVRAEGGQFTAGPAPTFGDRSLTVVDIDPRYGGGKGVGANPNFAGGAKFGSDPDTMAYEMIGGKPTPVMTVGQAFATQSRGPGINQYEKAGTLPQQLDAMSARGIRDAEIKKKVDQMIGYQITGVLPPEVAKRAEADKKKKEAEAAAAAPKRNPAAPSQP